MEVPGTQYLTRDLLLWAGLLWSQRTAKLTFQPHQKGVVSQGPASAGVLPDVPEFGFRHRTIEKGPPIADHRQKGERPSQTHHRDQAKQ